MTIQNIKTRLSEVHPNQYTDTMLIAWVNDVEHDICEYLRSFEENVEEVTHSLITDEVMINEPDVYVEYLISRICLANEEYDRYNNHAAIFQARYAEWKDSYIRAHKPLFRGTYRI